uniref:Very-long-chain aldehyde decarbonylase CER1-like C-terminal domain-containing protein n=1 Tax=Brassica oleracea var. oleracea TaxID=109376 RepID=A0A0D3B5G5_BRAOL
MPMYDYIYGTNDKCSDSLYESLLEQEEEKPEAIHLTHLTSLDSIYHLRLGFASFSSHPLSSRFYLVLMKPITLIISFVLTSFSSRTFVFERNRFGDLTLHSHLLPKFSSHYKSQQQKESINKLIETAILEAEKKDVRGEELNGYGEMYVRKYPKLKIKIVDGTSLAAAVVVHSIPAGTREVLFRGQITKVARAIVISLCQSGIKVMVLHKEEHCMLARFIGGDCKENLVLTTNDYPMFPPRELRKNCFYHTTPAMIIPDSAQNIDSCENWLGRRVMSAWRVGGIVHALEGWEEHECGLEVPMVNPPRVWEAALRNGFKPLVFPSLDVVY